MSAGCPDQAATSDDGITSFLLSCCEKGNGDGLTCQESAETITSGSDSGNAAEDLCDGSEGSPINDIIAFHGRIKGSCGGASKSEACISAPYYDCKHANHVNCPRDRLQRHRLQVAGKVHIPDVWCGEERLHEWVSSYEVEDALRPPDLFSARAALIPARTPTGPPSTTLYEVSLQS